MPQLDMPLDELLKYAGRNPRPSDFDSYWDNALAQMHAIDPQIELVPAAFQSAGAECFHLYFTGVGGARIHAKYLRPRSTTSSTRSHEKHPAVLQFHGYTGHSGDWSDKLNYVSSGFCVAALDVRGQGGWSQDVGGHVGNTQHGHIVRGLQDALAGRPEKLLFRDIYLDCAQLAKIVLSFGEVDANRVVASGGSQGGGLTLACAALEPRIAKAAATFPFLCDYQRVWEMDLAKDAYSELRNWFRAFDPRHERENEVWNALGYIDNQHLASRIQAEVLMSIGLMDSVCPPSSQFAAYNKIESKKALSIYPDFGHESLPDNNDRVFAFLNEM